MYKIGVWEKIDKMEIHPDLVMHKQNIRTLCKKSKTDNTFKSYNTYFKLFCKWLTNISFHLFMQVIILWHCICLSWKRIYVQSQNRTLSFMESHLHINQVVSQIRVLLI